MHLEQAERKRDLRLRRRILLLLHAARVRPDDGGWLSGRMLSDLVDEARPGGHCLVDDAHACGLLRDLVAGGLAEQRDDRRKRYQRAGLDLSSYRITHRGVALIEQQIGPDPLIDDDRCFNGGVRCP